MPLLYLKRASADVFIHNRVVLKPVYMARSGITEGPTRIFSAEHAPGASSDPYIWLHSPFTRHHIYEFQNHSNAVFEHSFRQ